ncbi:hypothetical protein PR202_ga15572 [Eleusine coracana subsp. coracana]|uniref:Protein DETOXIFICATION n=1 Tax=Eleusine coracana subsp. coracana TaxID=191504 RepID=A0AAV5CKH4_ELECO|nr:hypothetical protein PR202_ga15572 [Eleusine coracana subsp. coracana]
MESQNSIPLIISELPEKGEGGKIPRLAKEVWEESKKLWEIVGPAVFMRLVLYAMNIISQAFAGHLGDRELAAFSIASTVVSGLSFGLLLGMASALETLCGQAYGAKQYHMLGVYMQRSWLILLGFAVLLAPTYVFSEQILVAPGQSPELSRETSLVSMYMLPLHFIYAILLPLNKFLQCQLKNWVTAVTTVAGFPVHVVATWLLVQHFRLGLFGAAMALNLSWALITGLQLAYAIGGGCPETWKGFSALAFVDLKDFVKLSAASGVMLCLESWYYRILIFLTAYMKNAELAVDALSICLSLAGWEMMIHLGFLAGTGVRVANELGAANGKVQDLRQFKAVISAVDSISVLLALTILLNGVQPVLSGVAVGSGWQALVAYVNIGSYYLIGVPFGVLLAWGFHYRVLVRIFTLHINNMNDVHILFR